MLVFCCYIMSLLDVMRGYAVSMRNVAGATEA